MYANPKDSYLVENDFIVICQFQASTFKLIVETKVDINNGNCFINNYSL